MEKKIEKDMILKELGEIGTHPSQFKYVKMENPIANEKEGTIVYTHDCIETHITHKIQKSAYLNNFILLYDYSKRKTCNDYYFRTKNNYLSTLLRYIDAEIEFNNFEIKASNGYYTEYTINSDVKVYMCVKSSYKPYIDHVLINVLKQSSPVISLSDDCSNVLIDFGQLNNIRNIGTENIKIAKIHNEYDSVKYNIDTDDLFCAKCINNDIPVKFLDTFGNTTYVGYLIHIYISEHKIMYVVNDEYHKLDLDSDELKLIAIPEFSYDPILNKASLKEFSVYRGETSYGKG